MEHTTFLRRFSAPFVFQYLLWKKSKEDRHDHGSRAQGIPVPLAMFGFTGHKASFFGDLHTMGTDGVRFFTEQKSVTAHWFSEQEAREGRVRNSWDGMI